MEEFVGWLLAGIMFFFFLTALAGSGDGDREREERQREQERQEGEWWYTDGPGASSMFDDDEED